MAKKTSDQIAQELGIPVKYKSIDGEPEINSSDIIAQRLGIPVKQKIVSGEMDPSYEMAARQKEFEEFSARIDTIPNLNKEEKEYLIEKNRTKELYGPLMDEAIRVMTGNHERQRKKIEKDASGKSITVDIKTPEEIEKEYAAGKISSFERKAGLWKYSSDINNGSYYMKDYGNGIKVPVPLMVNEKPEANHVAATESIWGTQKEAEDDMWITDVAKRAFNLIPSFAQGLLSTVKLGVATNIGDYNPLKSAIIEKTESAIDPIIKGYEKFKFKGAEQYKETVVDVSQIEDYKDIFSSKIYDFSPAKIVNTSVLIAESLGELALTRGALKAGNITGKVATFGAGYISSVDDALKSADEAGIGGQSKYVLAALIPPIQAGLETKFGIEGKIFDGAAKAARKEMIGKIIKDNVEIVGGKLTKESVEKLYKETIKQETSFLAKYAKNTLEEATTEVLQSMTQNAAENIYDSLVKDDPEAAKYGTKWFSPKAIGDYISSAVVGGFGGFVGSPLVKNQQSQSAYDAVKDGKEVELKGDLASALDRGKLTQDDYDRAIFKIDSYKKYYDATKDRPVTDEEKRKIFDLTYEKENIRAGIEKLKQNNPDGIQDQLIATKEQELKDYSDQIKDIWSNAEARTSTSPVEEAKVEVPMWKTKLETFRKNTGNADKLDSKNLITREQINSSIGVTPELNRAAESFSIDFKAPHLPEGSGIQIRKGILYEPYTVKKEGEQDQTETRELPVYAMQDKDDGTWLFATGEKTDTGAPDVSYLIKLNEEGGYEGHQEFKYETAKKNELNFDNIVQAFNELGIEAATLSDEIKGLGLVPEAEFEQVEEIEEFPEAAAPVESELFKQTYESVQSGNNKAKLKILPNKTVGVTINGIDVPFASQRFLNIEDLPSGDVEVNVRPVENVEGKFGRGLLVETQDGTPLGYLRRAGAVAEKGRVSVENVSPNEDVDIDVPVELSDVAKDKLKQIEKDQYDYELIEDELGRRYVNKKTGESYTSVSTFVSGKSGGDFKGDKRLKRTAFEIGNIINGIVKDFFNGTIKAYSNYADNISRDDYNDIVNQLEDVRKYARDNGYSIVTKPLIITDDVNKIAGQPNVVMVDEDGNFYVYDVATLRNTRGLETKELINKKYEGRMSNAERISAQVNILADILNNKYGLDVKKVGVIPFDVDYDVAKKETDPVKISQVTRTKRIDFKRKQILKPTGKTSAEQVQEKVEEGKPTTTTTDAKADIERRRQEEYAEFIKTPAYSKLGAVERNNKRNEIFAKYDAELAALEGKFESKPKEIVKEGIPFTITSQVRQQLYDLGYSKQDVNAMKPEEAQDIISKDKVKEKPTKQKAEKKPKEVRFKEASQFQRTINGILNMVSEYNSLKKGRLGKNKLEGRNLKMKIKNAVSDLKNPNVIFKEVGDGIRIVNKNGNPYSFVSYEFRNRGKAKDYVPLENRDKGVIELFNLLSKMGLYTWPKVMSKDGKRMSNKQLSAAINDVNQNIPSNGADSLLKQLELIVKDGQIETEYQGGQSNFIPLDLFLETLSEMDENEALQEDAKAFEEIYEEFPVTEEMISEAEMAKAAVLEQEIEEETAKEKNQIQEGKDIVREQEGEEYPFQKAKSVKSIFDEAVKLFYKIRGTEGASKKRNLTQERKDLLKENPTVRFIDNNISSIFEQLEKKGIIKRKGDCP